MSEKVDRRANEGKIPGQHPELAVTPTVTEPAKPRKDKALSRALDSPSHARRLLSVKESALYLGVSPWKMRSLGWGGAVPEVNIGRRTLFDREDLDRFIERSKTREK